MKKKEKKIILILLVITAIILSIFLITRMGKDDTSENKPNKLDLESGIDVNDEAYEGKKVYEKDGDIIIENPDGSKTIESLKGAETDMKEASEETKEDYEITDVKVNIDGNRTSITGKIKNNTRSAHKVSVGAKFYSNENRVKGSTNAMIENLKAGETQSFEMVLMGNMTGYTHKVEVEYTN